MFPNSLEKAVEVKFHVAADNHSIRFFGNQVHFLHRNGINFVVAIQTFDVLSVP